jgi:hypothetical protein
MQQAIEIQSPNPLKKIDGYKSVFLAGSIEKGMWILFAMCIILNNSQPLKN